MNPLLRLARTIEIPDPTLDTALALRREGMVSALHYLEEEDKAGRLDIKEIYSQLKMQATSLENPLLRSHVLFLLDTLELDLEEQENAEKQR